MKFPRWGKAWLGRVWLGSVGRGEVFHGVSVSGTVRWGAAM